MTVTCMSLYDRVQAAAEVVRGRSALVPEVGIILGTGLGGLAREIAVEAEMPYGEIPGFPLSTVETHAGRLLLGRLGGAGRGHAGPLSPVRGLRPRSRSPFPVRVLHALGAGTLVVSNACGGMNPLWGPGDLVLLSDHINLLGDNPLVGPNDERLGPRFPGHVGAVRSRASGAGADDRARARHRAARGRLRRGAGPQPGDPGRVPDAARHGRRRRRDVHGARGDRRGPPGDAALGISIITDQCLPDALEPADIGRIIATAGRAEPHLTRLITALVERLA